MTIMGSGIRTGTYMKRSCNGRCNSSFSIFFSSYNSTKKASEPRFNDKYI